MAAGACQWSGVAITTASTFGSARTSRRSVVRFLTANVSANCSNRFLSGSHSQVSSAIFLELEFPRLGPASTSDDRNIEPIFQGFASTDSECTSFISPSAPLTDKRRRLEIRDMRGLYRVLRNSGFMQWVGMIWFNRVPNGPPLQGVAQRA